MNRVSAALVAEYKELLEKYYDVLEDGSYKWALQPVVNRMNEIWVKLESRSRWKLVDHMALRYQQRRIGDRFSPNRT